MTSSHIVPGPVLHRISHFLCCIITTRSKFMAKGKRAFIFWSTDVAQQLIKFMPQNVYILLGPHSLSLFLSLYLSLFFLSWPLADATFDAVPLEEHKTFKPNQWPCQKCQPAPHLHINKHII